jgi:IclR family KDG regulon transcriptional repressor
MTPDEEPVLDPKNHVASVVKAVRLLELFSHDEPELNLETLVRRSKLTRTTTFRLLATLILVGWVERNGDNYRLSLQVFRLGSTAVGSVELRHEARAAMVELAGTCGEDVYLVVPDGPRAVCLERIEGRSNVRMMALDVGKSMPLHIGGGGSALLAAREAELLPLVLAAGPLTTPTGQQLELDELKERLSRTRERGYSLSLEDVTIGVGALGSVIRNARGVAVAAVSVGAMLTTLLPRQDELASAITATAADISTRLGYIPR